MTIVVDGCPLETTTLREDVETDGRWAKVAFGRDFPADARRRDFTINALSLTADGTVHDYVGGLGDLRARRVRFIGEADARIREDYLRILRFFRFSARFAASGLDPEGLSAAIRARDGLARLSRERVRTEFLKLLAAPRAGDIAQTMSGSGILEPIFGSVGYPRRSAVSSPSRPSVAWTATLSFAWARLASRFQKTRSGCTTGFDLPTPSPTGSKPPPRH